MLADAAPQPPGPVAVERPDHPDGWRRGDTSMSFTGGTRLTREQLAWELVELVDELSADEMNELLAKNVPLETLRFIAAYAEDFAEAYSVEEPASRRLPNLVVLGYLLSVLEQRLIDDDEG
jgi:hypothetical protein